MFNKIKRKKVLVTVLSFLLILGFIFAPCFVQLCSKITEDKIDITKKYSTESLLKDLEYLVKLSKKVHPNLYANYPKVEFDKEVEQIKNQISSPLTRKEFFLLIAPLISKIDGHSAMYSPQLEVENYLNNGGKLFPYDILIKEDSIYISKDYTSEKKIPLGSEIKSINGISAQNILDTLLKYESRETKEGKIAELNVRFKTRLWLILGFEKEFEIEYLTNTSPEIIKQTIQGLNKKDIDQQSPKTQAYSYKTLENKIGIIEFNSFSDADAFDKFLKETFTQIKKDNIEKLIIDIRNNGGGNYVLGEKLINYISNKEYKLVEKQEIKASPEIKKYLKESNFPCFLCNFPVENIDELTNKVWDTKDNNLAVINFEKKKDIENNLKFNGKVYVAVSPFTYSSAAVFANSIKYYEMGTLIGEETGGLGIFYSDPYKFKLPNTKLEVGISYRKFYLPGNEEKPIQPNIVIENNMNNISTNKDDIIEYIQKN